MVSRALKTEYEIMKFITIFLLSFIGLNSFGQNTTTGYFLNEVGMSAEGSTIEVNANGDTILVSNYNGNNLALNTPSTLVKKYMGTPYYGNKWYLGTVTMEGSDPSPGLVGFNVVKGVIYYSPDKNTQAIELSPPKFALDGLIFQQMNKEIQGAKKYYYNVLVEGEPMLIKQHTGKYSSTKDGVDVAYGTSSSNEFEGKFEKYEDYYFVIQKTLVLVKPKKSFAKAMGPYHHKVKEIVSKYNLDLSLPNDIIKLAHLLNQ
ncbi:hypothetical protein SAMN06298216_3450 [Spirosomataceae bacterium TFI 002]|nr:hypothetical protein SAMN06298216_3450 [Spirosomataceae bacterium TFI 002]